MSTTMQDSASEYKKFKMTAVPVAHDFVNGAPPALHRETEKDGLALVTGAKTGLLILQTTKANNGKLVWSGFMKENILEVPHFRSADSDFYCFQYTNRLPKMDKVLRGHGQRVGIYFFGDTYAILAPSSIHASTLKHTYCWITSPSKCPVPEVPGWLVDFIQEGLDYPVNPEIEKLVNGLMPGRSLDDQTWKTVSKVIHKEGLDYSVFQRFSGKRPNLEAVWDSFFVRDCSESVKTDELRKMAQQDIPNSAIVTDNVLLGNIATFTDSDSHHAQIMRVFFQQSVIYDGKNLNYFSDGKWCLGVDGSKICHATRQLIAPRIVQFENDFSAVFAEDKEMKKRLDKLKKRLDNLGPTKRAIDYGKDLFLDSKFIDKCDANVYLLGFDNGVLDLEGDLDSHGNFRFRPASMTDYVTMSTKYDYSSIRNPIIEAEIHAMMAQHFVDPELREFVWNRMAECLIGMNASQIMQVWTGTGANGKSKLAELFTMVLGEYAGVIGPDQLCKTPNNPEGASPAMFSVMKKRVAFTSEPQPREMLSSAVIKRLTGHDEITVRKLYGDPCKIRPHFTIILQVNDFPPIDDNGYAVERRLDVIPFLSTFKKNPKKDFGEFEINEELNKKFPGQRLSFLHILLEHLKQLRHNPIVVPKIVKAKTDEALFGEDPYHDWLQSSVETTNSDADTIALVDAYNQFLRFVAQEEEADLSNFKTKDDFHRRFPKKELKSKISSWTHLECHARKGTQTNVWTNCKIKTRYV